ALFHEERIVQYVSLPPASLSTPLPSLCASLFSPLLLTYFPPARGIVLAYRDVELSSEPPSPASSQDAQPSRKRKRATHSHSHSTSSKSKSKSKSKSRAEDENEEGKPLLCAIHDEYSSPFLWASASFLIFRPVAHAIIPCHIVHQFSSHVALSYLNSFPVSVLKTQVPKSWTWNTYSNTSTSHTNKYNGTQEGGSEGEGYWTDSDGMPIPNVLEIRIRDFEVKSGGGRAGKGHFGIEGSLINREEELAREQARDKEGRRERRAGK
ncbi:hypothetical protein BCR34DRAFT_452816, partial [Clohesyomyces aquaticus]